MSAHKQMKRGVVQSLYKYLPESWIDFSVTGDQRKQIIAKVDRWNADKLVGINNRRLIRVVNKSVMSFQNQGKFDPTALPATVGFGDGLTENNCYVLTPKANDVERGIIANISPLTFYCKHCHKVYQFKDVEKYRKEHKCKECGTELTQFRQIYFCQCGYATDEHNVRCPEHGEAYIHWYGGFEFRCSKCHREIPMNVKCPICNTQLWPKVALDPSQFFTFSLNLIDLIDEKLESFITDTDYGKYAVLAYWLGKINKEELNIKT